MYPARLSFATLAPLCALVALLTLARDVRSEASVETPVAGSRLVPLFLLAEDGSRELAGWLDTARGERCAFAVSGDGLLRCLPIDDVLRGEFLRRPRMHRACCPRSQVRGPAIV